MKYVIRVLVLLAIWTGVTILVVAVMAAFPGAGTGTGAGPGAIEPAEGVQGEAAWDLWLALSVGLLITVAIALGGWVYYQRKRVENRGTDLRGGG